MKNFFKIYVTTLFLAPHQPKGWPNCLLNPFHVICNHSYFICIYTSASMRMVSTSTTNSITAGIPIPQVVHYKLTMQPFNSAAPPSGSQARQQKIYFIRSPRIFWGVWRDSGVTSMAKFPVSPSNHMGFLPDCFTAALTTPHKVLSIWRLVELKMLDFSDCQKTSNSILT